MIIMKIVAIATTNKVVIRGVTALIDIKAIQTEDLDAIITIATTADAIELIPIVNLGYPHAALLPCGFLFSKKK